MKNEKKISAEKKAIINTYGRRLDVIRESDLKLDDEQENFLLYGATDEQFEEMLEHLKQQQ